MAVGLIRPEQHRFRRLVALLLGLFLLLILRLVQLQILQGPRYARLSDRNRIREILLPAPRGRIFDRDGKVLAETKPSFTCTVVPTELAPGTLALLAQLLEIPANELEARIRPVARYTAPVNIKRNLSIDEVARIEENNFRLEGVHIRVDPIRSYPNGAPYAHLIGHIGEVTDAELQADTSLRRLDYVGRSGIELGYERFLRGRNGHVYVEVDARGQELGLLPEGGSRDPVPGYDLHLTVSDRLQCLAYRLLRSYQRGAAVGIDVRTGDILCLVSYPAFDPNLFLGRINSASWESLTNNQSKPFYNRAVTSCYPPGSTIKPLIALGALNDGTISRTTRFTLCAGSYKYGNRIFRCNGTHGSLDVIGAITYSCNVYFYQLALTVGLDRLTSFMRDCHLGQLTGIDIPGEKPGIIPDRTWLNRRYGKGGWGAGSVLNFGIGQGEIQVTPLQLASAYAALAADGIRCRPHVVARIDSAGHAVFRRKIEREPMPFADQNIAIIKQAMTRVVEHGTATSARLNEVTVAGKTGTAQNPPRQDHAWFVGYAPADAPEVAFAVIVENAGHGAAIAAPIVGQLVRAWFCSDEPDRLAPPSRRTADIDTESAEQPHETTIPKPLVDGQ